MRSSRFSFLIVEISQLNIVFDVHTRMGKNGLDPIMPKN